VLTLVPSLKAIVRVAVNLSFLNTVLSLNYRLILLLLLSFNIAALLAFNLLVKLVFLIVKIRCLNYCATTDVNP